MQVMDGSRRQSAGAVPAACLEGSDVGGSDLLGPELGQKNLPQKRDEVLASDLLIALKGARCGGRFDI